VEDLEVARESGNADQRGREEARAYRGGRSAEGHAGWDFLPGGQESRRPQEEVSAARSTDGGPPRRRAPVLHSWLVEFSAALATAGLTCQTLRPLTSRNLKKGAA